MILHSSHEPTFVILSVIIAIATAYAALNLAARATVARGRDRRAWIMGGAVAMGMGINGMHFVGNTKRIHIQLQQTLLLFARSIPVPARHRGFVDGPVHLPL
ncbi:MAG: MHYT domain-containing protein [Nitrospirota bacterium]